MTNSRKPTQTPADQPRPGQGAERPVVLVAEDEETDALLLTRAFQRAELQHQLVVVCDGKAAVDYLSGNPPYSDRQCYPLANLVLLDLKMPRMNGFDVLEWIGTRPELKDLPIVVLTSSSDQVDIQMARELGASDYLVKPHAFVDLVALARDLHARWLARACPSSKL